MNAQDAAIRIRELSEKQPLAGMSQSLENLADALEQGGAEKERWANVDLFAVFLGKDSLRPAETDGGRFRAVLEHAPSFLIFLPILTTWIGLTVATWYYRDTLHDPDLAGQPFLQRWEGGFDGHLWSFFTLDWFAAATVGAILLLLAALLAQSILANKAERRQREEDAVRAELSGLLVAADLELAVERRTGPGQVGAAMSKAIKKIDHAAGALGDTASKIKEAGDAVGLSQQDAIAALGEVRAATQVLEQAVAAIEGAAKTVGQATSDVGGELGKVTTACTGLAGAATDFAGRLEKATDDSRHAMSTTMGSSAKLIATALDAGTEQVRDALVDIRTTGAAYTHRAEAAADQLGLAHRSVQGIADTAGRLESRLTAVNQTEDRIVAVLGELKTALEAAGRTTRTLGQDDLRDTLKELTESVHDLNRHLAAQAGRTNGTKRRLLRGRRRA